MRRQTLPAFQDVSIDVSAPARRCVALQNRLCRIKCLGLGKASVYIL
jgi:hypothetical protein